VKKDVTCRLTVNRHRPINH